MKRELYSAAAVRSNDMMLHPVEPLAVTPTPWLRTFACRRCKGASQVNIRKVRRIDER